MPTNAEAGMTFLPDGGDVHWSREQVIREAARLLAARLVGKSFRVGSFAERSDGSGMVHHGEARDGWLHAFLHDWEDGPGEGETVQSVEAVH